MDWFVLYVRRDKPARRDSDPLGRPLCVEATSVNGFNLFKSPNYWQSMGLNLIENLTQELRKFQMPIPLVLRDVRTLTTF
jgi:hypothetical protein